MPGTTRRRLIALAAATLLIAGFGCQAEQEEDELGVGSPSPEAELTAQGDFELTGTVQAATLEDLPEGVPVATPELGEDGETQDDTPDEPGRLTVELQSMSDDLRDSCNVRAEDTVDVFWTEETELSPSNVLEQSTQDLPEIFENRFVSAQGTIYLSAEAEAGAEAQTDCTLVAERIEVSQGQEGERPVREGRDGEETPEATSSPSPTPTATATVSP